MLRLPNRTKCRSRAKSRLISLAGFFILIWSLEIIFSGFAVAGESEAYSFLCNQMDKYIQGDIPRLIESYSSPYPPGPYDPHTGRSDLYKIAFTYDNAVLAIAFIQKGTETPGVFDDYTRRAKLICQGLLWHINHDPSGEKRLRDAYYADQDLQTSSVSLFPDEYSFSKSSLGSLSWAIISLLRYYIDATDTDVVTKNAFLQAAIDIGEFIHTNLYDSSRAGYFHNKDKYNNIANYKSSEQNIDAYVAFLKLYDITEDARYKQRAYYAKRYVEEACWDNTENKFYCGSDAFNNPNTYNLVEDVNSWSVLAFGPCPKPHLAVNWNMQNLTYIWAGYQGIDFGFNRNVESSPDGVWFEGTAHIACAYQALGHYGFLDNSQSYIDTLNYAQQNAPNADGNAIVSASKNGLTTGFDGFNYYSSPHIASTSWYIMALGHYNPLWGIGTNEDIPYSNVAFKKPVSLVPPTVESPQYCQSPQRRYFKENLVDGITSFNYYLENGNLRLSAAYPGGMWWDPDAISPHPWKYKLFDYEIDLQDYYQICLVKMYWGYFGAQVANTPDIPSWHGKPYIRGWRLSYLDYDGQWKTASEFPGTSGIPGEEITERNLNNITASKLRITAWGYHWSGIFELEAYGRRHIDDVTGPNIILFNIIQERTNSTTVDITGQVDMSAGDTQKVTLTGDIQNSVDITNINPDGTFETQVDITAGDGTKTITATAYDNLNNQGASLSDSVELDTNGPAVFILQANPARTKSNTTISGIVENSSDLKEVRLTGPTTDAPIIISKADISNGSFSRDVTLTSSGNITATAYDDLNNQGVQESISVTKDTTGPDIISFNITQERTNSTTVDITGRVDMSAGDTLKVTLTGDTVSPVDITSINLDGTFSRAVTLTTGDGTKTITATGFDDLENPGNISLPDSVIYDNTPPNPFTVTDEGKFTNNNSQLTVFWSTSDDALTGLREYKYAVGTTPGGNDVVDWTSNGLNTNIAITGLSLLHSPTYYISVRAYDNADNYREAHSDGIQYDTPPTIESFSITDPSSGVILSSFHQNITVNLGTTVTDPDADPREYKYIAVSSAGDVTIDDYPSQSTISWNPLRDFVKATTLKVFARAFGREVGPVEREAYIFIEPIKFEEQ